MLFRKQFHGVGIYWEEWFCIITESKDEQERNFEPSYKAHRH